MTAAAKPRCGALRWLLAAAGAAAGARASHDAYTSREVLGNVTIESLPNGFTTTVNLVILGCVLAVVVLVVAGAGIRIALTGSATIGHLLFVLQLVDVLAAGLLTWVVTYAAARESIELQTNRLLVFSGKTATNLVDNDLSAGVVILRHLEAMVAQGQLDVNNPFPSFHEACARIEQAQGSYGRSVTAIYMGREHGDIHGLQRVLGAGRISQTEHEYDLWIGVSPKHCRGGQQRHWGTPQFTCLTSETLLQCSSNAERWDTCAHPACNGSAAGGCEFCVSDFGEVPSERCPRPRCEPCPTYLPGAFDAYRVLGSTALEWDLPNTTGLQTGMCTRLSNKTAGAWSVVYSGERGTQWIGGPEAMHKNCSDPYDPRVRPWYSMVPGQQWTDPYEFTVPAFDGTGHVVELGLSATLALRNPAYRGTPYNWGTPADLRDDPWLAVLAVDYTLESLSEFLYRVRPSATSIILLATASGQLAAGTIPLDQSVKLVRDADGNEKHEIRNVLDADFKWRHMFLLGVHEFGSLANAAQRVAIFQGRDHAVLNQPVTARGTLKWVLLVAMPYSDITEDAERATTRALGLACAISFSAGIVVLALIAALLRPLRVLVDQMGDVAEMRLDHLRRPKHGGIASEVRAMRTAFNQMVRKLADFREYLPPGVWVSDESPAPLRMPSGDVAICFTDIVGSSSKWEASPAAMDEALTIHNDVIRRLIAVYRGYEVKTIGDAFFVSFERPADAVLLALATHDGLLAAEWPNDPAMAAVDPKWAKQRDPKGKRVLWNGLTLRIGISFGQPQVEENHLIGRKDYRGPKVNLAARLESSCPHGCTQICSSTYEAVSGVPKVKNKALFLPRSVNVKGIGDVQAYVVVAPKLRMRLPTADLSQLETRHRFDAVDARTDSSGSAAADDVASPAHGPRATLPPLKHKQGSVAIIHNADACLALGVIDDLAFISKGAQDGLTRCATAAKRTQGTLSQVLGAMVLATWNIVQVCGDHEQQAIAYAAALAADAAAGKPTLSVGIASGRLVTGEVGAKRQRFHVLLGLPMGAASAAAAVAREWGEPCLLARLQEATLSAWARDAIPDAFRPIDTWGFESEGGAPARIITLEQPVKLADFHDRSMQEILESWDDADDSAADSTSTAERSRSQLQPFRRLYEAALTRGAADAVRDLRAIVERECPLLRHAVEQLAVHVAEHPTGAQYRVIAPIPRAAVVAEGTGTNGAPSDTP